MPAERMWAKNRRTVEMMAIQLEATADDLPRKYLNSITSTTDYASQRALKNAAKLLRRALEKDSLL